MGNTFTSSSRAEEDEVRTLFVTRTEDGVYCVGVAKNWNTADEHVLGKEVMCFKKRMPTVNDDFDVARAIDRKANKLEKVHGRRNVVRGTSVVSENKSKVIPKLSLGGMVSSGDQRTPRTPRTPTKKSNTPRTPPKKTSPKKSLIETIGVDSCSRCERVGHDRTVCVNRIDIMGNNLCTYTLKGKTCKRKCNDFGGVCKVHA